MYLENNAFSKLVPKEKDSYFLTRNIDLYLSKILLKVIYYLYRVFVL